MLLYATPYVEEYCQLATHPVEVLQCEKSQTALSEENSENRKILRRPRELHFYCRGLFQIEGVSQYVKQTWTGELWMPRHDELRAA